MQTVELFSGTGSFSKVAKSRGHNIFRVELYNHFEAELHKDIMNLNISDLPEKINILWASPPCTTFSVASLRHYWVNGKPKNLKTWYGIALIHKTLDIIKEVQKNNPSLIWFIENPRGMLRKREFMLKYHKNTVTYCQYGDNRQKPTDIWNNFKKWKSKPMCKPGAPCHESARRGEDKGTQSLGGGGKFGSIERARIPSLLFEEIFYYIENDRKTTI